MRGDAYDDDFRDVKFILSDIVSVLHSIDESNKEALKLISNNVNRSNKEVRDEFERKYQKILAILDGDEDY